MKNTLRKNVRYRLDGPPEKRPGKRKTHANPFVGQLYAIFIGLEKKGSVDVSPRVIIPNVLPVKNTNRIVRVMANEVREIAAEIQNQMEA